MPFTVASAPERLPLISLHFRPLAGNEDAPAMLRLLERGGAITFDGPHGDVYVVGPTAAPLTIIAGGTGISQAAAIVEHLTHTDQQRSVQVSWSVADAADRYWDDELIAETTTHEWLHYERLVDPAVGVNAMVHAIESGARHVQGDVILAGGPGFVYAVLDAIEATGAPVTPRADALSYAPRR